MNKLLFGILLCMILISYVSAENETIINQTIIINQTYIENHTYIINYTYNNTYYLNVTNNYTSLNITNVTNCYNCTINQTTYYNNTYYNYSYFYNSTANASNYYEKAIIDGKITDLNNRFDNYLLISNYNGTVSGDWENKDTYMSIGIGIAILLSLFAILRGSME